MALHPANSLNIISLCTGGGGLDLGIELAIPSARSVCLVEREAFAVSQLVSAMQQGLVAQAPVWSDVTTFNGTPWRGLVDGVIGGIPCQPHSLAGRKRGQHDQRDLWSDARRIIVQSGAWFALIENVGGMLSAGADEIAGAERVWRDLRKLGFAVEGGLFTAAEVGASHQRERVFILAVVDPGRAERWSGDAGGHLTDRDEAGRNEGPGGIAEPSQDVADPGREPDERRRAVAKLPRSAGSAKGQGNQRQRHGHAAGDSGKGVADADGAGPQGRRPSNGAPGRQAPERHARLGGRKLGDAKGFGRGEGRTEPKFPERGRTAAAQPGTSMDDAESARSGRLSVQPGRQEQPCRDADRPSLFPPSPADADGWRDVLDRAPELEPAIRRVADGVASRVDVARVDRLRMLGNGVVPLEAAHAVRTLATRLAARGSAGANRLVRMMEF